MSRRRLSLLVPLLLAGCTSSGVVPPPELPSPSPSGARVQAVVEVGPEAYGLTVTADAVWATSFQAGTLTRIDPATNTGRSTRLGSPPVTLLAAGDAVWAAGYGPKAALWQIDRVSGSVRGTASASSEVCCDLTWDGSAVWGVDPAGAVFRFDGSRIGPRWPVTIDRDAHTNVVYAGGRLWVSSDTTALTALDPASGRVVARVDVGGGVPFLVQDGLVWGAAPALLWAVDPASGSVARTIPLAGSTEVLSLAFDGDEIWVGIRRPGQVGALLRLADDGSVLDEVRDVDIPARIAVGFGSVWVTDSGRSSVYRIATGS